jgi:hypothetical protein
LGTGSISNPVTTPPKKKTHQHAHNGVRTSAIQGSHSIVFWGAGNWVVILNPVKNTHTLKMQYESLQYKKSGCKVIY